MLHFDTYQNDTSNDISAWLRHHAMESQGKLFAVACWWIWKAGNEEIFQVTVIQNFGIVSRINNLHHTILRVFDSNQKMPHETQLR